jgi:hypothetical protein
MEEKPDKSKQDIFAREDQKNSNALVLGKPNLLQSDIEAAKEEITDQNGNTAKLIGLICHLAYWNVFGHLNPLPLDKYHMKQLFISIA